MSFPSVQQAPVYTPVASSLPQQAAYIQQGRCGNCGVTLNPYPQTQLNQGDSGQYQMSAQGKTQSSGGTLQDSHQFAQASGQSYVGGQRGQQQAEAGQVQSSQQSVVEASAEAPAKADTGKSGFDFAAFFSPLNKDEREDKARNAAKAGTDSHVQSEQSRAGTKIERTQAEQTQAEQTQAEQTQAGQTQAGQTQAGQTQAGQASSDQIMAEDSQSQITEQNQGAEAGFSQDGQVSGGVGSDQYTLSGQAQQLDTAHLAVQQHASAPAAEHSSPASSVPSQAFAGLNTQKMHTVLAEMDREISEFTTSTVDQVVLAYKQTSALAAQQRAFLQERGVLRDEACASCGHFEVTKPVSSSGTKVR